MEEEQKKKKRVCMPSCDLPVEPQTRAEFEEETRRRIDLINKEFTQTFEFLRQFPKTISFFGSARLKPEDEHYQQAERLARRLCGLGYVIITGGGPGIMEAGNKGAKDTCGTSIGFNIELPTEQSLNEYVTHNLGFHYFFSRKVALAFAAEAYIYFPGGYGTLDEFFEIITLIQTKKIEKVPVILVGEDFWKPLDEFIKNWLLKEHGTITPKDVALYSITDDEDEIVKICKAAPSRDG